MLTFLPTIKDTKTQLCSFQKWQELVNSPQTAEYIKQFRKTKNIDWKQRLPAVNFHGYDPKVLKGLDGSRKQSDLIPTGLFMLDIDHVANPRIYWGLLQQKIPEEELEDRLALVHLTPSGEGLRIVMKGRTNIKDDQTWLANILGVQHDACTKDLSRWSFVPTVRDILFINPEILFANAQETTYNSTNIAQPQRVSGNQGSAPQGETNDMANVPDSSNGDYPDTYHGIAYKKIVETLVQYHGGTPEIGERHARIITLANDLRFITDSNADWLMQIIPNFDKPDFEKRSAVTWAIQHNSLRKTKALSAVLDWLEKGIAFESSREEENALFAEEEEKQQALASIPQMPEKLPKLVELLTSKVMPFQRPALSQMIFPPLAAHVPEALFVLEENKPFELSLMGVVVGTQSVGKGCIDAPVEEIMRDIKEDDEVAEAEMAAYDEYENTKAANDKGRKRPTKPIRILETNVTFPALLQSFKDAVKGGYAKNLCCFTKCEEIEELYDMGVTNGTRKITQLIKKTYDRGRIGSGRQSSVAVKGHAPLRWNWLSATTPDKARAFFMKVVTDGTVSRVDFSVIIPPDEDFKFKYGSYDEQFADALEPYIQNLRDYRGQWDKRGELIPLYIPQVDAISAKMDDYITQYAKTMPDDTWKNFAWRTKMNALKKIIVLYIANGGKWEEEFESFCWWSFHYAMWCKMNLFMEKATEAFGDESIVSSVSINSPLDFLPNEFTKEEFDKVCKKMRYKSKPSDILNKLCKRAKKVIKLSDVKYAKA